MTRRHARVLAGLATLACLAAGGGGCARNASTAPAGGRTVTPVALPDVSGMAPSVQRQLRDRHAATESTGAPPAVRAGAYGELGKLLMAAQLDAPAQVAFANAEALAPSDVRWIYYQAHLARRGGDLPTAEARLQRVLTMTPDDIAARVWAGEVALAMGRPTEARPHFERALALQPSSLSARFGLGRLAMSASAHPEAIRLFEEVLASDPEAAAVHYPLSQAYRAIGDLTKADAHLARRRDHEILPADPLLVELDEILESAESYETRGIRALNAKQWADAVAAFARGLELAPDSAALHFRLGTARRMQGDHAAAEREFERAVTLDAKYFPAQYSLGVLLQAAGRHPEAIARFEAALAARATYAEARLRLADSLRRVGRVGEALAAYDTVLAADATQADAAFGRAMSLVQAGRYRQAVSALSALVSTHAEQPVYSHALARVLASAPDAAARDGQRALAMADRLAAQGRTLDLGETLAMALAEVGETARAAALQRDLVTSAERAGMTSVLPRLRNNLSRYARGLPCRQPWPDGDVP